MARRGVSHITNCADDRRFLLRIELNLPHLRGTRANTASEREHDCSVQTTAVHGVLLLLARNRKRLSKRCGRSRPTTGRIAGDKCGKFDAFGAFGRSQARASHDAPSASNTRYTLARPMPSALATAQISRRPESGLATPEARAQIVRAYVARKGTGRNPVPWRWRASVPM